MAATAAMLGGYPLLRQIPLHPDREDPFIAVLIPATGPANLAHNYVYEPPAGTAELHVEAYLIEEEAETGKTRRAWIKTKEFGTKRFRAYKKGCLPAYLQEYER